MKKLLLLIPLMVLFAISTQAQELSKETKKAISQAKKAYNGFIVNNSNKAKLAEAKDAIENVMATMPDAKKSAAAYILMGNIYDQIATQTNTIKQLGMGNVDELPKVDNPPYEAFLAYKEALNYVTKGSETKGALDGISSTQGNMNQFAVYQYEAQEFEKAYNSFDGMFQAHDILKENGKASSLDDEARYKEMMYFTGLAAYSAQKLEEAGKYYEKLFEMGTDKPLVYQVLYEMKSKDDLEGAYKYLEAGRKTFPDDISLLFAEINHFLKLEQLDILIEKIDLAIEKEPKNKSLYFTKGNLYDQLYQKAVEAGNEEEVTKYFDLAMKQYESAIEIDPDYVDAVYGKGALYYNRAASLTRELQTLADDYSADGMKKYEAKKVEVFAEFDKALPFFKKAESMDPNDINTLIALKEIFARKNQLDVSQEFDTRLKNVQGGGKNDTSYFNE